MNARLSPTIVVCLIALGAVTVIQAVAQERPAQPATHSANYDRQIHDNAARMLKEGQQIFRFDTFGSEDFWGGKLRLHEALAGEKLGGVSGASAPRPRWRSA